MTAQKYIFQQLEALKQPLNVELPEPSELENRIVQFILSKKFRKVAISDEQKEQIRKSVNIAITNNQPIKATLVFGGYKLWRLEESPEPDWAELFSLIYYTKWMKPICEIYKPGVWFDFFSDDVIIPIMNNVSSDDTIVYQKSFQQLLDFIKQYQPKNLNMTLNRVGDQYDNYQEFIKDLEKQKADLARTLVGGLPALDDVARATLDLNVKTTEKQLKDPKWQEKVQLVHDSYAQVSGRRPYYRTSDKFNIFTTPYPGGLSVGTTKDSVMKFWIGVGVLKPSNDEYRQIILSPNQLKTVDFSIEDININHLKGENFKKIRVLK